MFLRQIEYLQAVIEQGNFYLAAEQCHVSQSAISQQIRKLEEELGAKLLERHNRTFSLTPAGEHFYRKSLVISSDIRQLIHETKQISNQEQFTLNIGYYIGYHGDELTAAISLFSEKYPSVNVQITVGSHEELYHGMENGSIDLALNDQRRAFSDTYNNEILAESRLYIELSSKNPLSRLETLESSNLKNIPCILIINPAGQKEEQEYFIFSLLAAFVLGILWIYPAWKITGKIIAPLEEAIRLQKEFVMFAGHELKTPVTVMKASLDMLEREGIHSKYLDYAVEENEKMRKLVIELLDYSKMEYQEEKSLWESVDFSQCIEGISLEFEAMAFEKEVILTTDIEQNLVIAGNKEMLERMTETLLENAIRHTETGKEVKVVLKKDEKKVRFSVENQGKTIPEEERRRIFEKFYHVSSTEEEHYGLGLAIAQSIAVKHHTEITVISENGWNCFVTDFPLFYRK